jgi:hypothetical protein
MKNRPNIKPFNCRHKRCGWVLGATDGERLYLFKDGRLEEVPFEPVHIRFICPNTSSARSLQDTNPASGPRNFIWR